MSPQIDYGPLYSVIEYLADHHSLDVNIENLHSECRQSDLIFHRAIVAVILKMRGYGPSAIGRLLHRDHATVYNLWKYEKKNQQRDPRYKTIVDKEKILTNELTPVH